MLIINPGLVCTDTVIETFVIYDSPDYQIGWSGVACFEAQDFTFNGPLAPPPLMPRSHGTLAHNLTPLARRVTPLSMSRGISRASIGLR